MNVLYISSFADPDPINSNSTSISVVTSLLERGVAVKMMTCHRDSTWKGELPDGELLIGGQPILETIRSGIPYVVAELPSIWYERHLTDEEWQAAVQWGVEFLKFLKPNIVHLQQWQKLWWMLASAQKLNIPTVYSVNDYGMTCEKTTLLTSKKTPCLGPVSIAKCSLCSFKGRSFLGKCNECLAYVPGAFDLLNFGFKMVSERITRLSLNRRIRNNYERSAEVLKKCSAIIVGSPFGVNVISSSGVHAKKIHTIPWFHDQKDLCMPLEKIPDNLIIGFIGRISPEKGLHILLAALESVHSSKPVTLRVAGGVQGAYAKNLYKNYRCRSGSNNVEWVGWVKNSELKQFFSSVHMTIIPSNIMETGPLSLVESLAHKRPAICSDLSPMKWTNTLFGSGWSFPVGDVNILAEKIKDLSDNMRLIIEASSQIKEPPSRSIYIDKILKIYNSIV